LKPEITDTLQLLDLSRVQNTFDKNPQRIFTSNDLKRIVLQQQSTWLLTPKSPEEAKELLDTHQAIAIDSLTSRAITSAIVKETPLQKITFPFPYRTVIRFAWGDVPTFQLIQSVEPEGYFTHFTALQFHGLTQQIPKTIYFNDEQHTTGGGANLTQHGLDNAFKGKCRISQNVIDFRDYKVCRVNGRHTGQLGVITPRFFDGSEVRVTNLERSLIDATVRPAYSGGIFEVAHAYKAAAPDLSIPRLINMLPDLNFVYPYHQAIGYYLQRSGCFSESDLAPLRDLEMAFDFYLDYGIRNKEYVSEWRLFIPQRF